MNSRQVLTLCLLVTFAGCSSQNSTPNNAPAEQPAPSTATASAPPQTSILNHDGCTIDIVKVCKSFIDQPQFTYNGDEYTWQRFQESAPRHPDVEIWARYPDNSVVADIQCHVDAQNRKVDWARLLPNPPLIDKSWDYAKSKRWCQEDSPDYSSWSEYWRSGITQQ
jgi:hypothetical protein